MPRRRSFCTATGTQLRSNSIRRLQSSRNGERIYLPQLLLIEGAIAHARGEPDAAIASIRRATEEARAQGAGWLELLALTELCEREAASAEDRRALVVLTEQLAEADGTPVLARARAFAGAESA